MSAACIIIRYVQPLAETCERALRRQPGAVGTRRLKRPCSNLKATDYIFAIDPALLAATPY